MRGRISLDMATKLAAKLGVTHSVAITMSGIPRQLRLERDDKTGVFEVPIRKADHTVSEAALDKALDRCIYED